MKKIFTVKLYIYLLLFLTTVILGSVRYGAISAWYIFLVIFAIGINTYFLPDFYILFKNRKIMQIIHFIILMIIIGTNSLIYYFLGFENFGKILILSIFIVIVIVYTGAKSKKY